MSFTLSGSPSLVALGWDERLTSLFGSVATPDDVPARVARVGGDRVHVLTAHGPVVAPSLVELTTGDWVLLRQGAHGSAVADVLPRRTALTRTGPDGRDQVLAANVDAVFVAHPLDRELRLNRLDRELVLVWDSGALPVVVLTKADAGDPGAAAEAVLAATVGVDVVVTSVVDGRGLEELAARLVLHRTAVLLGPSGAGKSSLVNHLLGYEALPTAGVREGDHRGRHTTAARHLLPVPTGGMIIDTPGLRSLALDATSEVEAAFSDIEELGARCRFRDCRHEGEPGCAVADAVDGGALPRRRLDSYRKLQREVAAAERARDPRAERERRARIKAVERSVRANRRKPG